MGKPPWILDRSIVGPARWTPHSRTLPPVPSATVDGTRSSVPIAAYRYILVTSSHHSFPAGPESCQCNRIYPLSHSPVYQPQPSILLRSLQCNTAQLVGSRTLRRQYPSSRHSGAANLLSLLLLVPVIASRTTRPPVCRQPDPTTCISTRGNISPEHTCHVSRR